MKLVIDTSIAERMYLIGPDTLKVVKLRSDFLAHVHELLAPDTLIFECIAVVTAAEKKALLGKGGAVNALRDLQAVGIGFHPSEPLLPRAIEISLANRLTVSMAIYFALAEQENCQLLTADQKVIRNTRKNFSFVLPLALLP